MLRKCHTLNVEGAELVTFHTDVWSLRPPALPLASLPVLTSRSSSRNISSLRHGPPEVVSVVGQLQPLVHGCARLPRCPPPPPPPPPIRGGRGTVVSRIIGGGGDEELATSQPSQRPEQYQAAQGSADGADADAATTAGWARPARTQLLRLNQRLTAAQAAVQLLRIANQDCQLLGGPEAMDDSHAPSQRSTMTSTPPGLPPLSEIDMDEAVKRKPSRLPSDVVHAHIQGTSLEEVSRGDNRVALAAGGPEDLTTLAGRGEGGGGGTQEVQSCGNTRSFRPDGLQPPPAPLSLQQQQQQPAEAPTTPLQTFPEGCRQLPTMQPARQPNGTPLELLAGLDRLALCESLEVLQPLLPTLSVTQLQRVLETLVAVRHVPTDPWFHDWLLASESQLRLRNADATEVYGMLVSMRVLRLRPLSQQWVSGAVWALSAHLQQLDAVQVVDLMGCFGDMAIRPPDGLLARVFALLHTELPQLQPHVLLDLLSNCSMLRITPPAHVLNAVYGALTPAALVAAPAAQLCRLAAALAALRAQPPVGLLLSLSARADVLLRSAVADTAAAGGDGGGGSESVMGRMGCNGIGTGSSATFVEAPVFPATIPIASAIGNAEAGAGAKNGGLWWTGEVGGAQQDASMDGVDSHMHELRPRRGKARRFPGVATTTATPAIKAVEASTIGATTTCSSTITTPQLSRLLRDFRVLGAPLPTDWSDLCGHFLAASMTDPNRSPPVVQVSYLLRSAARCGLELPPSAVRVVTARLEASLLAATAQRKRLRQRQRRRKETLVAGGQEGEDDDEWNGEVDEREGDGEGPAGDTSANGSDGADCRGGGGGGGGGSNDDTDFTEASSAFVTMTEWHPRALSVTVAALVPYALHLQPSFLHALYDNLYDSLERLDLPELTSTLHSLPLLAGPCRRLLRPDGSDSGSSHATSATAAGPRPSPPASLLTSYLSCLHGRMHRMQPWQLSMCLFALLRLGVRPDPHWMDAFLGQVYRKLPYMNEVQIATIPWVVARMSYRPQAGWVERLLSAAAGRLSCLPPRYLCQLLWAVGEMGYIPERAWMARWLDKARGHFRTSDGRTLAALAWAVARLGHRPEKEWLQELCEHLIRRLPYTSPRAVTNTLAALAALGHRPDTEWFEAVEGHVRARLALPAGSGRHAAPQYPADGCYYNLQDLSHVCYSLARLGHRAQDVWLDAVATEASRLALLEPEQASLAGSGGAYSAAAAAAAKHIALLMLALSRHRRRPPPAAWAALLEGMYPCLSYASPQALAVLLAAAAALRLPLPREHAGALLLASHRRMGTFSCRALAMAFRGFVEVGVDPGPRWLNRLEEVLLDRCEKRVPDEVHDDDDDNEVADDEEEEGGGPGRFQSGQKLQMQTQLGALQLGPRERASMLWAVVTLETASLEGPAVRPYQQVSAKRLQQKQEQQKQRQQPASVPADTTGVADGQYPPYPRWVRKPGPLGRPLRNARLIALLLPSHEEEELRLPMMEAEEEEEEEVDHHQGGVLRHSEQSCSSSVVEVPFQGAATTAARRKRTYRLHQDDAFEMGECNPLQSQRRLSGSSSKGKRDSRLRWKQLACYSGQDLALLCWALGRLRLRPHGLTSALLAEVSCRLAATLAEGLGAVQGFTASEMAMAYWGLSSIGVWPTAAWRATAAEAALQAARGGKLPPRDIVTVLVALARWRRRPLVRQGFWKRRRQQRPRWQLLVERSSSLLSPGRIGWRGKSKARRVNSINPAEQRFRTCTAALAEFALTDSAAYMCASPLPLRPLRAAVYHQLWHDDNAAGTGVTAAPADGSGGVAATVPLDQQRRCYDARTLAALTWALANMGTVRRLPDAWLAAFMPVALRVLARLPPSYRVTMLDSLSRLGLRPGAAWLHQVEQVVMHDGGLSFASSYRALDAALERMTSERPA